jgi:hypothetical protein
VETSITEVLLLHQQAMNQAGTDFLLSQTSTISFATQCPIPIYAAISLSYLDSPLFLSVETICGRPQWG